MAGARAGLAGERSGLFMEQIRIIKEMRDADVLRGRTGIHVRPPIHVLGKRALCTSTHKAHYEQKSIMYSTSIKSSETEHFTLFHCA